MKPTVFFAIPCGEFYGPRRKVIEEVSRQVGIDPIIEERFLETEELWRGITEKIDDSDFFVADVSCQRQNVAIELGYALARKRLKKVGIFTSSVSPIPSDATVFKCPEYSSLTDFRNKLREWLASALGVARICDNDGGSQSHPAFSEDFMNQDWFLRRWFAPSGSSWHLSHEGLRFTGAHFPIQTMTLGLLKNYEFEFKARIDKGCIGWTVQTTMQPGKLLPSFCVLFQMDSQGTLTPYIWNEKYPNNGVGYEPFETARTSYSISRPDGWFTLITRMKGELIEIERNGNKIFSRNLTEEPFSKLNEFQKKQGNVGFRCYLDPHGRIVEEATVSYAVVRELS